MSAYACIHFHENINMTGKKSCVAWVFPPGNKLLFIDCNVMNYMRLLICYFSIH